MIFLRHKLLYLLPFLFLTACGEKQESVTLTIESWRSDDLQIWQDTLLPAFMQKHPEIKVIFAPTAPTEYNAALNVRLQGGTAGDIITCRPFDVSLDQHKKGHLAPLNDLPGLEHFNAMSKSAWSTDDGATVFCIPMASVIHGFIYNADLFKELGLTPPKTETEFFALLEKIKKDGRHTPMSMGTADQWEAATMGFQNIGPAYWKGEAGRRNLIQGKARFTDAAYVDTLHALARWKPYLAKGFEAQSYADSQNLFTLGRALLYPAGSWEIAGFNQQADFAMGAFPPPSTDGKCYISDHTDIGMGLNAKTKHPKAARIFLEWMTGQEFAQLFSNALPGFFSLSDHKLQLTDKLAQEFIGWRENCESTIRNSYHILSRGEPNLENELWRTSVGVIKGTLAPEKAAAELQAGLDRWFHP